MLTLDDLLDWIARLTWVLYFIYVIIYFVHVLRQNGLSVALIRLLSARVLAPILIPLAATLVALSVVFVLPQEAAVVISVLSPGGVRPQALGGGIHLIIPVLESADKFSVSWQTYTMASRPNEGANVGDDSIVARTNDGQEVRMDSSLIFRVDPAQLVPLYRDWQHRYVEDLIRPVVRGVVRTEVSQFTVQEVNSSARADLERALDRMLADKLGSMGLIVDQFILRNISFSPEYAASIEEKQVAQESKVKASYEADAVRNRAKGEKDRLNIEAEGRADAIRLEAQAQADGLRAINQALQNNANLLNYNYIQKLAPNIRVMLLPSNAPLMLPLPGLDSLGDSAVTQSMTATLTITNTMPTTSTSSLPTTPSP